MKHLLQKTVKLVNHLFETYIITLCSIITFIIIKSYINKYIQVIISQFPENNLHKLSVFMGLISGFAIIYLLIVLLMREINYEKNLILKSKLN